MNTVHTINDKRKANLLITGSFLFFYLYQLIYWIPKDIKKGMNEWAYTDWLIDYSSGFVRRGLSGEIIDALSIYIHPRISVSVIAWGILTLVFLGYIRLIMRSVESLSPYLLASMLFLPSLLPFYLYDHGAFGRKETLGFLFLLLHLYGLESFAHSSQKKSSLKDYLRKLLPITLILLPVQMLVHENTFLLFIPVHIMITWTVIRFYLNINFRRMLLYLAVLYSPVLMVFFIIIMYGQPSFEVALAICEKWVPVKALNPNSCPIPDKATMWAMPGALAALPWSFSQASSLPLSFSNKVISRWGVIFLVMSFLTIKSGMATANLLVRESLSHFDLNFISRHEKVMCCKYFLLPLAVSIPLYVLGWDWGRWFAVTSINYVIVVLSSEINYFEGKLAGQRQTKLKTPTYMDIPIHNSYLYVVGVFFLLSIIFFVRVPHCCNDGFNMFAEPVRFLLKEIIELF